MKNEVNFNNYNFEPSAFEFVNSDNHLTDEKPQTKRTSFAKDSFKRFCKNKSSVVAAIILGIIILMAIFVPIASPHSTDKVSSTEAYLEPKLFETGTGFWDGTRKCTNIAYDVNSGCPYGYYAPAVLNLVVDDKISYTNSASPSGKGGYVMFENQSYDNPDDINYLSTSAFDVTADGNYKLTFEMFDTPDINNSVLGEYRVVLYTGTDASRENVYVVKDWSTDYSAYELNLSQVLVDNGLSQLNCRLAFDLKPIEDKYSYILIKSLALSADEGVSNVDDLEQISFADATEMVLRTQDGTGVFPYGYWRCNGRKGVYASEVYFCSFTYDTYAAVYDATEVDYAASDFQKLIDAGLCTYDASIGPESFEVLDESCPIESVISQKLNSKTGKLITLTVRAYRYSKMGYDKMPKFLFGTDAQGRDLFTRMFAGLRTSLLLGVFTFAFCFVFGLVWGAICGYFGGWVDIIMERFCDILGGVPWIVLMTLCILHLGNNFLTFFLALCLTGWMGTAGLTRTQFYRFKHMEYVLASRTLGSSDKRLIFKHILPNSLGTIITSSVLMIPSVIFSEASLAYLNLGLQGLPSFGVLLSDNQQYISSYPFLIVLPSIIIALLMISFNLFGNGLRDAVNPTLKGVN